MPLAQIVLGDIEGHIFVYVRNNGVGPLIIDRLTFTKDGKHFSNIEDCLNVAPQSYMHDVSTVETGKKVILPNSFLAVFETKFEQQEGEEERNLVRQQLTTLALKVYGHDVYDNKIKVERDFQWFGRHINEKVIG
ncbi:hypothetical protein [Dyadobacter frigoris]|nr:hypothetical protein [Dyadobacter frigoris]